MKRRISNFTIIFIVFLAIIGFIGTYSVIKIQKHHEEKLLYSMKSKVEYKAERCFLEGKCVDSVTLNDLYTNNYLDEMINPVTKEVIDSNLVIEYIDETVKIDWSSVL